MGEEKKYVGNWRPHCYKCGRFIGKDGFIDVFENEEGYSLCASCLKREEEMRKKRKNDTKSY